MPVKLFTKQAQADFADCVVVVMVLGSAVTAPHPGALPFPPPWSPTCPVPGEAAPTPASGWGDPSAAGAPQSHVLTPGHSSHLPRMTVDLTPVCLSSLLGDSDKPVES